MRNEGMNWRNGEWENRRYNNISFFYNFISACPRFTVSLVLLFILCLFFNFPFSTYTHASNSPKVIESIEVRGLTRIEKEEMIDLICFNVGDILDNKGLSEGIRRVFKKGIFMDIQAVTEPYDDGIKLIYIVKEIPVINKITVKGNQNFLIRTIKNIFTFREGEDFIEEFIGEAELSIVEFYQRRGFPDTEVKITVEAAKKPSEVNIHVNIEEGQPLIIRRIEAPRDDRRLITLAAGDIFDKEELDKIIKKIMDYYKKEGYINPVVGPYEFTDGNLVIPVNRGRRLEVTFKNNTVISTRKLKKEIHFIENGDVSDEAIAETVKDIKKLYDTKGYYYSQIAAGVEEKEDVIKVSFIIFEGKQVVLKKIRFTGITISPEAIKRIIPLVEDKPFNNSLLNTSRESVVRFYNALGYQQIDVVDIKKDFGNDGRQMNIEFIINEGLQTKFKSIQIVGNKEISASEIRHVIQLKEDSPYNVIDIGDARYRVLSLYSQSGYMDAHVDVESVIRQDSAFLTFKITENKPSIIGKIILRGNHMTKAKIIKREFTLEEGDHYNYEEITKIKQRLYKLGIFNEVSIDMLDPDVDDGDKLVRDVLVSLREAKPGSVEIGLGYGDYEGFRGSLDIGYSNLGGYHRQIGFRSKLSSVEERYILSFKEPWFLNKPNLLLKVFLMKEDKRAVNIETRDILYKIDKLSFIAGMEKKLIKGLKVSLSYEYSFTDTTDVKPGVILSKEDIGTIGIGSISPSLFYDTRDNPFDPASGSLHGIVLKFASKAFLSETEFVKGTFQSSWFVRLTKGIIFAFSLRGGGAYGFEETKEIPLIERFFLGGRTTVRGYSHDTLGPTGSDGSPTGGNVFALTNGEFRFSLGKGFGLVTFVDGGNVWKTADEVESKLKYTAGMGLRYRTPVGPIRIDYGHKLKKEEGESTGEVHFSFGHAF